SREDLVNLLFLVLWPMDDLHLLTATLRGVVLGVASRGEISTQSHGDGAGRDLGEPGENDKACRRHRTGETGGQRKGNGQAIRKTDDDVANGVGGLKMSLMMLALVHGRVQMHVRHRP